MAPDTAIETIDAREVLDSRGNPTVEVEVRLAGGARGRALVPSGASTGAHEALELRDGDARFGGKGVRHAVANVRGPLADAVRGHDALDGAGVDAALREADGSAALARLGANAVLGVSLATAHAAAAARGVPLHVHVAEAFGDAAPRLPVPMLNVLNGGAHADNGLDVQEVMIAPTGLDSFAEALRAGAEIYHRLARDLGERGLSTAVGDEGGFAPRVDGNEAAIELVAGAVGGAGYELGEDVQLALDVAATELVDGDAYRWEGSRISADDLVEVYARWVSEYPIYSIEDGLGEDDWAGWARMRRRLGPGAGQEGGVQLVGDDLFVTDRRRLARGIEEEVATAVLVKPNQIGTLADTMACVRDAYAAGFEAVMSHRSGETEDTTIADLAVAMGTGQIKTGAPCRGERTAKYNQLLRIEAAAGALPYGLRPTHRAARPA